ncbi:MAG: ROK family protein [Alphaproteobacteria bacterium]|nr:ROK family protein [Alphaproteobacteria bacterium]
MTCAIGLDIGGTKIAGALYDDAGSELTREWRPTPSSYEAFLDVCASVVHALEDKGSGATLGVCAPYVDETTCSNIPYLAGKNLSKDFAALFKRSVPLTNDANCAALAEALEGAGRGFRSVFGLILGTGVGGGFVLDGRLWTGLHGLAAEVGHLPLPYCDDADGPMVYCSGCGQTGCIEQHISGGSLARLYAFLTKKEADAKTIATLARQGDPDALRVLDRYYTIVAKAMTLVLHTFDPDVITVSGGLNALPGLYEAVPERWGLYSICKKPKTRFVPSSFGALAGMRGAALMGQRAQRFG